MILTSKPSVYLLHEPEDEDAAQDLAAILSSATYGLRVWIKSQVPPGTNIVTAMESAVARSAGGMVLLSESGLEDSWTSEVYTTLLDRVVRDGKFLLPVVNKLPERMPEFLRTRPPVAYDDHEALHRAVLRLLEPELGDDPEYTPELVIADPVYVTIELCREGERIVARCGELEGSAVITPEEARRLRTDIRASGHASDSQATSHAYAQALERAGERLGEVLAGPLTAHLARAFDPGCGRGEAFLTILTDDPELSSLPWEAAMLAPHGPLALIRRLTIVRQVGETERPQVMVPGPLRVLVAVASPGDDLDIEREFKAILEGIEGARLGHPRVVFIDESVATLDAIRHQLDNEPFHMLHLACRGRAGALLFEDEDGDPTLVSSEQLAEVLAEARHTPEVVVLSSVTRDETDVDRLEVAGALLKQSAVGQVVAMQGPLTEGYAAELTSALYGELVRSDEPVVPTALAVSRRVVEGVRQRQEPSGGPSFRASLPEYAKPVVLVAPRHVAARLIDATRDWDDPNEPKKLVAQPGMVMRQPGWVVGRRTLRRNVRRALVDGASNGALLWGAGGVGKSTLASTLCQQLVREGWEVVAIVGKFSLSSAAEAAVAQLSRASGPVAKLAELLSAEAEPNPSELSQHLGRLLAHERVVLLLDGFEANVISDDAEIPDALTVSSEDPWARARLRDDVARTLEPVLAAADTGAVLATCRYDIEGEWPWETFEVGILPPSARNRLLWRHPGLYALGGQERERLLEFLDGHPLGLEFADALLRSSRHELGRALHDVKRRMLALGERIGERLDRHARLPQDTALRVELAHRLIVEDAMLEQLLDSLDQDTLAFLRGIAALRKPAPFSTFMSAATAAELEWTSVDLERALDRLASRTLIARVEVEPAAADSEPRWVVPCWIAREVQRDRWHGPRTGRPEQERTPVGASLPARAKQRDFGFWRPKRVLDWLAATAALLVLGLTMWVSRGKLSESVAEAEESLKSGPLLAMPAGPPGFEKGSAAASRGAAAVEPGTICVPAQRSLRSFKDLLPQPEPSAERARTTAISAYDVGFNEFDRGDYRAAFAYFARAAANDTHWRHPYNMACAAALAGDMKEEARVALEEALSRNRDRAREEARRDDDLNSVRKAAWFQRLMQ